MRRTVSGRESVITTNTHMHVNTQVIKDECIVPGSKKKHVFFFKPKYFGQISTSVHQYLIYNAEAYIHHEYWGAKKVNKVPRKQS